MLTAYLIFFFFSSRRRHTRFDCDWSSDVCSSDLRQVGVVEDRSPGMPQFRSSPARPRQAVVIAADLGIVLRRSEGHQVEFMLIAHMRLEPLGRLAAIAG